MSKFSVELFEFEMLLFKVDCHDIVLFWRVKRMLEITCNSLRQQIINIEVRRLEREVKEILDDYSQDEQLKVEMLKGKRVELAEELSKQLSYSFEYTNDTIL